jgi:hypothetical protein
VVPVFDLELLELRRRIAVLEVERAGANRAVNDLLLRCWDLEKRLADGAEALAALEQRFVLHVHAEIARVREENATLHGRLHLLETSRAWRYEMRVRRFLAGAAAYLRRRTARS